MTAMAESYPSLAVCKVRDTTLRSTRLYSGLITRWYEGTINAHIGKHHTSIALHRLQPAISATCNVSWTLTHRIRITDPIAISLVMSAYGVIARARADAIFEGVDPNIHEVAVGLIGVAEELIGSVADGGIVGRGYVVTVACGYHG